jgi:hypothetical protein
VDNGFYLALGVTVTLPFMQWAVPTIPRVVAYAGVAGGLFVMLLEFMGTEMRPPLSAIILFLIGLLCIGGAVHLYLTRAPLKTEPTANIPASPPRGPTLEATNRSKIDATGAVIPGDLPFQFGKADQDSIIDMPGIEVTTNDDGTYTVKPGARAVNRQFPLPTGEFSRLSDVDLTKMVQSVVSELRRFNSDYRRDVFPPYTKVGPLPEEYTRRSKDNWEKYRAAYEEKFSKLALSLASEMLARVGRIEGSSMSPSAAEGGNLVYYGRFVGNDPATHTADFLETVANALATK